jgi:hypothetical protein
LAPNGGDLFYKVEREVLLSKGLPHWGFKNYIDQCLNENNCYCECNRTSKNNSKQQQEQQQQQQLKKKITVTAAT